MQGHDMSNYQRTIDAMAAFNAGDEFGIYKASEGLGFTDGMHNLFVAQARQLGKLVGHYHFAHIDNTPEAEAAYFLQCANWRQGDALVLDYEPYGQTGPLSHTAWALRFKRAIQAATGVVPWLYIDQNMGGQLAAGNTPAEDAELHEIPLWIAEYNGAGTPSGWLGWPQDKRVLWQYTSKPWDKNIAYITPDQWRSLAGVGEEDSDMARTDKELQDLVADAVANHITWGSSTFASYFIEILQNSRKAVALNAAQAAVNALPPGTTQVDVQALATAVAEELAKRLSMPDK